MKILLIVIDSFGIGEMPDSYKFNDTGSNTYLNIVKKTNLNLKNLISLGLNNIDGVILDKPNFYKGRIARLKELTFAKDTTAGHYEIAGVIMQNPYRIFEKFPKDIIKEIERQAGCEFIGNEKASGTEIIQRLGDEHRKTKKPIIYTSADSVMQIAADTEIIPLDRLYGICKTARKIMTDNLSIGRIIARPFIKQEGRYVRTEDRKDYALSPPEKTMLDKLKDNNYDVISIGKIYDIFNGSGITEKYITHNNSQGLETIKKVSKKEYNGLVFANLVDTDMLYGHRNNYKGYADALKEIDDSIPEIISNLSSDDILIITADHGCDPTTPSTDHSREYVPLIVYGKQLKPKNFGTLDGFDVISKSILNHFNIEKYDKPIF